MIGREAPCEGRSMSAASRRAIADLRSQRWYAANDMRGFAHRQRTQQMGLRREEFMGKPVIAIINTWSEMSPCHAHLRDRAEAVKRGVWQAGGYPVELPALSVGEVMVKPSTMLYRNFLAMETEELLRSIPSTGRCCWEDATSRPPGCSWAPSRWTCRRSSVRRARCPTASGAARRPARAPTPRNTGTSCGPATSPRPTGSISRAA